MKRSTKQRVFQIWIVMIVLIAIAIAAIRLRRESHPQSILSLTRPRNLIENQCVEIIAPNALLNRNQILKLMSLTEPTSKARVRAILKAPYCKLEAIAIRAGAKSERETYLLDYDPTLWVIVLYEDNTFVGIRIAPRNGSCPSG